MAMASACMIDAQGRFTCSGTAEAFVGSAGDHADLMYVCQAWDLMFTFRHWFVIDGKIFVRMARRGPYSPTPPDPNTLKVRFVDVQTTPQTFTYAFPANYHIKQTTWSLYTFKMYGYDGGSQKWGYVCLADDGEQLVFSATATPATFAMDVPPTAAEFDPELAKFKTLGMARPNMFLVKPGGGIVPVGNTLSQRYFRDPDGVNVPVNWVKAGNDYAMLPKLRVTPRLWFYTWFRKIRKTYPSQGSTPLPSSGAGAGASDAAFCASCAARCPAPQ